jgi:UDP-N-acetylmuramoyl-tripeptide--D-alanyl-D-alanine ligase
MRPREALRARAKSKSIFIGVTGSSGKSTTTSLLGHILAGHGTVYARFIANTMESMINTLSKRLKKAGEVDYVVFEVGAFGVDTIRPMAQVLRPHVAVITMVRLEHFKAFRTLEGVAQEKRALVDALQPDGLAVLNADDPLVVGMASGKRFDRFGRSAEADYRISDVHAAYPKRLTFSLHWRGGVVALETPFPAEHFWLPTTAAVAAALELGVPAQTVVARMATYQPLANRCEVLVTDSGPQFLVDAVKSPWHSVDLAIAMMAKANVSRKRIVLGQISDYAGSSRKYHYAYKAARESVDQVIYVGDNAHRSGASQADRDTGRFVEMRTPKEVSDHIKQTAVKGELILLKSSSNLHLERIALAWTHDVKCWVPVCGKRCGCDTCGLFEVPFEEHRNHLMQVKRARRGWFRRLIGR